MTDRASDAWGAQRKILGLPARVVVNIVTAVLYAAAYLGLREASNDQWYLPAGLRFAALLVAPYRLWPALFVGDVAALASFRAGMVGEYGWAYYTISSVVTWPVVAFVVRHVRRATRLPLIGKSSDAVGLIVAGVLSAELVAIANKAESGYLKNGGAGHMVYSDLIVYSLGHLQGILLIGFVAALVVDWVKTGRFSHALMADSAYAAGVSIALAGVTWLSITAEASALMAARLFLLVPAVALSFKHGWRGAAVGAVTANIALFATIPPQGAGEVDGPALLMQEAFAFVSASLFALGARSGQRHDDASPSVVQADGRESARQQLESHERRQRDTALRAEAMQRDSRESLRPLVKLLRENGQAEMAMSLLGMAHTQSSHFARDVIDSIYPLTLERLGLFAAVESDAFASRFGGTHFVLDLTGSPHGLALETNLAAYRVLGEAVEHMALSQPESISVRIHCGSKPDGRGIVSMAVTADSPTVTCRSPLQTAKLAQLRSHVAAYGGSFHNRAGRMRLIVLDEGRAIASVAPVPSPERATGTLMPERALSV